MSNHLSASLDQDTSCADPWTQNGYSTWQTAGQIRRQWMQIMGFTEEEILEAIEHSPPIDIDEEIAQFNAACRLTPHAD